MSVALSLLGCLSLSCAMSQPAAARPNILWLIGEDLGPQLGCYGTKQVATPHLDRLAAEGIRFTRCFNGHVCSPSRSALMTGMYATAIRANDHRSNRTGHPLPAGVRLLTDWMRDAGYFTANVVQLPPAVGFKGSGKTDWNFSDYGKPFDSRDWADLKAHQPFFAQVNFQETHRPFHGPARADPTQVELPPYYPDHPVTRRDMAAYLDDVSELDRKVGRVLDQLARDGLASNTVVVFFGDNGQAHVRGKQFCYDSGLHVPLLIRWPTGLPPPAGFRPGTVDERLIHGIDLAPTMLALAGAAKPAKMQGRIFLGDRREADRDYVFGARDHCDTTLMRLRTARDRRFRYIRNYTPEVPLLAANDYKERQYPVWNLLKELHAAGRLTPVQAALCAPRQPEEELYDLEADPHEIRNLVASDGPEHRAALIRLRAALADWMTTCDDHVPLPQQAGGNRGDGT